ncbi:MAG: hypothetical protein PHI23_02635 [Candidatus Peribacteraceae bacterium]|nr:hypothetical protein [Candidatus Peribacteraceae bacterium]
MQTLFLTTEEQKAFSAVSASLREGWAVSAETQTSYETQEVLEMRAQISPLRRHPKVKELVEKVQAGTPPDKLSLPELSEEDIGEFFFMIGAKGISLLIASLLKEVKTDDDVRLLANLGEMRHKLLETNASISYV